jgi:benzil reductase ((S)-benzoin forming)
MNLIYITGASKGIGAALAAELLKNADNKVIGIARTRSITHNNYIHFNIDLSDFNQLKTFKFKIPPGLNMVALINNAASLGEVTHMGNLSAEMINKTVHLNLTAPMILLNDFIKTYQDAAIKKLVINITSGAATTAYDGWSIYCATKAGLDMMTKVANAEQQMKKHPVKILGIAPGVVDTNMQTQIRNTKPENFSRKEKFVQLKAQHQLYHPADVARKLAEIIYCPELAGAEMITRLLI